MISLFREDMIFCDKNFRRWTIQKTESFFSYSEFFRKHFGHTYGCDSLGRVYPLSAKVVKFSLLTQILKSKDEALFRENRWIWDGEFRFLDKSESLSRDHGNHVCFTSYMRSGNAFLRRYMEQVSGITSGGAIALLTSSSL